MKMITKEMKSTFFVWNLGFQICSMIVKRINNDNESKIRTANEGAAAKPTA